MHIHAINLAGVCTGDGPCVITPIGLKKNWVTDVQGLPLYIRAIAQALLRSGHSEQEAIRLAVGVVHRWAEGRGKVTAATRVRAAAALASWEAKRAETHAEHHSLAQENRMGTNLAAPVAQKLSRATLLKLTERADALPAGERDAAKAAIARRTQSFTPSGAIDAANARPGVLDLAMGASGDTASRFLPDEASVRKAIASLHRVPKGLQPSMRARIIARAKQLGIKLPVSFAEECRKAIELAGPDIAARRAALAKGQALPPLPGTDRPRYPITDSDSLDDAVRAVGRGKTAHAGLRAFIKRVAAKLGLSSRIPADW
jgi:hypothetical protein